jgi:hypothetical protein
VNSREIRGDVPNSAFIYRDGLVKTLGDIEARGINDSGKIIGFSFDPWFPVNYSCGKINDLDVGPYVAPNAINNSGDIVGGGVFDRYGPAEAWLYKDGTTTTLATGAA